MDYNYVDVAFPGQSYKEKVRELHASYASKNTKDDATSEKEHKRNLLSMIASLFV